VFCQIVVPVASNNTYFDVPCYGLCDIIIVNLQYHESGAATKRILELRSDVLRFPSSQSQFLTWCINPTINLNFSSGTDIVPSIKRADLNGKILINVIEKSTGVAPANMTDFILTLEVSEVNRSK
tara:strand:+ start:2561 stop:2935 length:375 start_codon:yes stop_codon:yes gene_type:complete